MKRLVAKIAVVLAVMLAAPGSSWAQPKPGDVFREYTHRVPLRDLSVLRPGEDVLKTGLTPKRNGQMVHGMEVNWPGIMVLIQREATRD